MTPLPTQRPGLTLIEMIITMAIIAVIASAVFASIDPVRRLNQARNNRRSIDVTVLLDSFKAYQADHDNTLDFCNTNDPGCLDDDSSSIQLIGENREGLTCIASNETPIEGQVQCAGVQALDPGEGEDLNISNCFVALSQDGDVLEELLPYIKRVPADPLRKGDEAIDDTRYFVNFDELRGTITLGACDPEPEGRGGTGETEDIIFGR